MLLLEILITFDANLCLLSVLVVYLSKPLEFSKKNNFKRGIFTCFYSI